MRFLIVAALFLLQYAQAQQYRWVRVAQLGNQFTSLSAVEFVDSLHGWTGPGSGEFFRTSDGGNTWYQCSFDAPVRITSIAMVNSNVGWSVGAQGTTPGRIMKTTDGGATWFQQFVAANRNYLGTASLTLAKNITSGLTSNFSRDTGKVVRTTNGGTTWNERTIADSIGSLHQVQFIDSLHGWMLAGVRGWPQSGVLTTSDGGVTWNLFRGAIPGFRWLSFIDTLQGWAVSLSSPTYAYRTTDAGVTWTQLGRIADPTWGDPTPSALSFVDSLNGWVFGYMFYAGDLAAVIFRTMDGGLTWNREFVAGGSRTIFHAKMLDRYHGWAVGDFGNVFAYRLSTSVPKRLDGVPKSFGLHQNYPNPFNPTTSIEYEVLQRSHVTITVHDVTGKEVAELVSAEHEAGNYRIVFDGRNLASGTYYYTMKTPSFTMTKQMTFLK